MTYSDPTTNNMTYEELEGKIGKQYVADWSNHPNGGGWIHKSAEVYASAFLEKNATSRRSRR